MSAKNHSNRHSDDEEDDLELLRLAALKSLHKKDLSASNTPYGSPPHTRNAHQSSHTTYSISQLPTNPYGKGNSMRPIDAPIHKSNNVYYHHHSHKVPSNRPHALPVDSQAIHTRQRLEQLDINEPYVPQRIPPSNIIGGVPPISNVNNGWMPESTIVSSNYAAPSYVPHKSNDSLGLSSVQLSPRSMAFVAENNDILMRRKGENSSPNYRQSYRSVSPPPFISPRASPGPYIPPRSPIPSSRGRSPGFRRRSRSRSPGPSLPAYSPRSPQLYLDTGRRGKSRTPPPAHMRLKSPPRRLSSRSPPPTLQHSSNRHGRPPSRSPPPSNTANGRRRSPQPAARYATKSRRSLSPPYNRRSSLSHEMREETGGRPHIARARSPPAIAMANNNHSTGRRNSCSPRRRSHSRSPGRKFPAKRSRERPGNIPSRRRSPPYNNNNRRNRNDVPVNNGFRNRGRKRSATPPINNDRKKRSRTKSPVFERNRRGDNNIRSRKNEKDNRKPSDEEYSKSDKNQNSINTNNRHTETSVRSAESSRQERKDTRIDNDDDKSIGANTPPIKTAQGSDDFTTESLGNEKAEFEDNKQLDSKQDHDRENLEAIQEEKAESSNDDDDDDDDDDGIDLFPSDESESENEGRFKSNTSKNERDRQAPTLSFTKLGAPSVPVIVKELKDVSTATNGKNSGPTKNDRDQARRGGGMGSNYDRRRDDRFRKLDNSRNSRNDRSNKNNSNGSSRRDRAEESNKSDEKKKDEKPMFKSTFQAVESEGLGRKSDSSERKGTTHIQRSTKNKDIKDTLNKENTSSQQVTSTTSESSSNNGSSSSGPGNSSSSTNGISGKKSIHLRLGAKTNTFKTAKKSTWSSTSTTSTSTEKV